MKLSWPQRQALQSFISMLEIQWMADQFKILICLDNLQQILKVDLM